MKKKLSVAVICALVIAAASTLVIAVVGTLVFVSWSNTINQLDIDMRLDMENAETSYFNWVYNKDITHDSFDANSGASLAQSTSTFNIAMYDSTETRKATMPLGLRALALYTVTDKTQQKIDAFSITEIGNSLVIRFVHRGTAFQIVAVDGIIDLETSFTINTEFSDFVDGQCVIKNEFLVRGGDSKKMADLEWSVVSFVADTATVDASHKFPGTLNISFIDNVLLINGTLIAS